MHSSQLHQYEDSLRTRRRVSTALRVVRLLWCLIVIALAFGTSGYKIVPGLFTLGPHAVPLTYLNERGTHPTVARAVPKTPVERNPVQLVIPSIALNVAIEHVGILLNGDLATPTQSPWENAGWYDQGPLPGQHGSAVIDGHLDRPGGAPAVFWNLRDLKVGDQVMVVNNDGTTLHFHVLRSIFYPPQSAPLQNIFANSAGTFLNLITCAGYWVPSENQTTLRLVVYTALNTV